MLLIDYLSTFTDSRALGLAPRTIEAERGYISRYIAPLLSSKELHLLTTADLLSVLTPIYQAGHTRTALAVWVYLHTAAKGSPCLADALKPIPRPKHRTAPISFLSGAQLSRLLHYSPPLHRLLWCLAGVYGLRRGEIAGLQFSDVQTDGLHITRQRVTVGSSTIVTGLKSASSRRVLPLTPLFLDLFEDIEVEHLSRKENPSAFIVPFLPHNLDKALKADLKALGLPSVTLHSLRHTAASLAVNADTPVNMRVLQSVLGHASISTTARIYAHVSADAQCAALNTICAQLTPDS